MKDKFFIDTNIFVYTFFSDESSKQHKSRQIIRSAISGHRGCISYQVAQEFINVALKKFSVPLSPSDCRKYFDTVLVPLCEVYGGINLFYKALELTERWKFGFYDSLIVSAALHAECTVLYSEDLQHQQKIEFLTIVNPFL